MNTKSAKAYMERVNRPIVLMVDDADMLERVVDGLEMARTATKVDVANMRDVITAIRNHFSATEGGEK